MFGAYLLGFGTGFVVAVVIALMISYCRDWEREHHTPTDAETLLYKYMQHVGWCEGTVFINEQWRRDNAHHVTFTDEEWERLENLADQ